MKLSYFLLLSEQVAIALDSHNEISGRQRIVENCEQWGRQHGAGKGKRLKGIAVPGEANSGKRQQLLEPV